MLRLDNSAPAIGNGPCCGQHVQLSQPGSESVLNAHASGTGKERPGFLYGVCTSAAVRPSAREWLQSLKLERRGRLHTGRWVRTLSHIVPLAAVLMDTRCLRWSQHMQTGWNPTPITTSTPSKWALASPPRTVIVNADAKSDPVWTPKIHMETHIEPGHRDSDDAHTLQDDAQSASLGLLLVPPFVRSTVQGHQYCTWLKLVSSLSAFRRGSAGRGDTVAQTLSRKKKIARILTAALQASRSVSTSRRFARGPKHGISGASPGYGRAQPPNRSTFVLVGPSRWAARQSEGLVARWFVARHGHATSQPETHATRAQAWLFDWPQSPDRVSRNPNDRRGFLVAVARGVPGGGSTRPGCHSTPRARKTTRLRGRQIRRSLTCPGQSCGLGVPGEHANPQIPLICR